MAQANSSVCSMSSCWIQDSLDFGTRAPLPRSFLSGLPRSGLSQHLSLTPPPSTVLRTSIVARSSLGDYWNSRRYQQFHSQETNEQETSGTPLTPHKQHPLNGTARSVVKVSGLRADDIRHPLDRQNTALMRAIPGLNELGRMLLGPIQEQILVLENLGSGVHVTESQLPALYALMQGAAELLQMPAPDLYVRQNPVPNAYTLAITGRKPFVVVHTSLLDLLTPAETQAVLAHELGHLKCEHGIWLTFANLIALGAYSIPGGLGNVIASSVEEQLMRWLRAAELTCDRAALVVTQDPRVVVSALMKLAGGSSALAHQLSVDAFLEQARSYDEAASSSPLSWYLRHAQTRQLSHPLPVLRAREIDRWARSPEYKSLLEKGTVILPQGNGGLKGFRQQAPAAVSLSGSVAVSRTGSGSGSAAIGESLASTSVSFDVKAGRGQWWFVDRETRW